MAIILRAKDVEGLWRRLGSEPRTRESYFRAQMVFLASNAASGAPFTVDTQRFAFIGNGAWRITCTKCGEPPCTDPDWGVSCCFYCGAIHTNIVFPDNYREIEALLVKRHVPHQRNWAPPETLEDLINEQIAAGDPV